MNNQIKSNIKCCIQKFSEENLTSNALALFSVLGYKTDRQNPFSQKTYQTFKDYFLEGGTSFNEEKALVKEWKLVDLLFQLTKEEITSLQNQFVAKKIDRNSIETYLFFAIELEKSEYSRSLLAQITREVNKIFPMPVMILFKHGHCITLAIIDRRPHKTDERKDVLKKVTLIKDISIDNPHRAHIEILFDLSFDQLFHAHKFKNFDELHNAWQKTLDTKTLNKRFYKDLFYWYLWAMKKVQYPGLQNQVNLSTDPLQDAKVREHNAKNLIRLLTRILFVWFFKEKNLIPDELFNEDLIKQQFIKEFYPQKEQNINNKTQGSKYYRAVLQNLFFATLNQEVGKREFRKPGKHMNVTNLMRYESYFIDPKVFLELMEETVPFMNGGLFECLDKSDPDGKGKKGGDKIIYEDGFSDRPDNNLCVPDYLFFSPGEHVDLSEELADKKQKNVDVRGLINILKSYKFTVVENTPIEEDIALDPELLGRVFENLLASYNPETKTTARKQLGSFYTPREIVNYMVDESLKAYLKKKLEEEAGMRAEDAATALEFLIGYYEKDHLFNEQETKIIIHAIDNCKILDPACGSGAFPMGILHKMVHILHKLDPDNEKWKELQRQKAVKETEEAFKIGNKHEREERLKEISDVFENNSDDYGRKLYLIENCIYGVDVDPIATQISKLRFFISLIVDQKSNKNKENFGIRPLPNLETKFVAADALIGIKKSQVDGYSGCLFDKPEVIELEERLKEVRHGLFGAKTQATKHKLREEDNTLREKMGDLLFSEGIDNETARQLAAWDPYNQNAFSSFFDPEWMFGVSGGFDLVIGNPPYIQLQKLKGKPMQGHYKEQNFSVHDSNGDMYCLFYEKAMKLLIQGGNLCFITSNKWMRTAYGEKLREYFLKSNPLILIDLGPGKFESATVDTNIMIMQKAINKNQLRAFSLSSSSNEDSKLSAYVKDRGITISYLTKSPWFIGSDAEQKLKEKIEKIGKPLRDWDVKINFGIKTGFNEAFIIDNETKERLCKEAPKSNEIIKPILRGRDIERYGYNWAGLWLLQTGFDIDIPKKYPAIYRHLLHFEEKCKKRDDQGKNWWNLRACAYYPEFKKEKVVWKRIGSILRFGLDSSGMYCLDSTCIMTDENLKYICAYLNSKLGNVLLFDKAPKTGTGDVIVSVQALEPFLIPPITPQNQPIVDKMEKIVDKIMAMKKDNPQKNTSEWEHEIDKLVYQLFELTDHEIKIIESKNQPSLSCRGLQLLHAN